MQKFKKVYIEITNICNKNCSFCSNDKLVPKEMSVSKFEHVIKEVKEYTNYIYLHVKGEPLMHSHFLEILNICTKYQIKVNITTNGTLLLNRVTMIIESPCVRQINISLHSFEDIEDSLYLKNILEAVDKIKAKTDIIIVYRFWALKDKTMTHANNKILMSICDYYSISSSKIEEIKNLMNIKIGNDIYINKAPLFVWPSLDDAIVSDVGYCYGLTSHIGVLADGTVVPCCLDSGGCIKLGNIFTTSLSDILNSDRARYMAFSFHNHKVVEELCQKCQYRKRFKRNVL